MRPPRLVLPARTSGPKQVVTPKNSSSRIQSSLSSAHPDYQKRYQQHECNTSRRCFASKSEPDKTDKKEFIVHPDIIAFINAPDDAARLKVVSRLTRDESKAKPTASQSLFQQPSYTVTDGILAQAISDRQGSDKVTASLPVKNYKPK